MGQQDQILEDTLLVVAEVQTQQVYLLQVELVEPEEVELVEHLELKKELLGQLIPVVAEVEVYLNLAQVTLLTLELQLFKDLQVDQVL
jgi:hypothetical protein|tara:strand:+ start:320 stop:583 length:264 start_codon:yes stop_codon:yes gene_type:complete